MQNKKTVLITGASSGIGKATAIYFQENGWNVAASMRNPEKEVELGKLDGVKLYKLDVTKLSEIKSCVEDVVKDFGGIDVLVNNAGYGAVGPFEESTPEDIQRQYDVNVFGLMNVTREVLPIMRKQQAGVIVNISSIGGRIVLPLYGVYNSTKWAVDGFSEGLMFEVEQFGIKVRAVEPGAIKTDFNGRSEMRFKRKELTAYDAYTERIMQNYKRQTGRGEDPRLVAREIYKAATSKGKRLRYPVGMPTGIVLPLRRFIPERFFLWFMKRLFN